MTGGYEASVKASGEGPASELSARSAGRSSSRPTKGRIGKATLLTRILGVVNATDVFAGKDKTRVGDAIPYDVHHARRRTGGRDGFDPGGRR